MNPPLSFRLFPLCCFSWLAIAALAPEQVTAQTNDQVRQQAESQLRQMTPEEIDQKLKELGMTRDEAIARAREYGINLEDYLNRAGRRSTEAPGAATQAAQTPAQPQLQLDPRLNLSQPTVPSTTGGLALPSLLQNPRERRLVRVPGFAGRRGIDTTIMPFGYDIFSYPPSTFTPSASAATPPSYALGPGDDLQVTLWGETRLTYALTVNREGNIVVPDVGPIAANGMTVPQFRQKLLRRMTSVYSSLRDGAANARTFLDVSLGKLKTIQVFALGQVSRPGGYAIPSMSSAMTAMYAAGGPAVDGTLRDVQIIRSGENIPPIDLYRYIVLGDRTADMTLQDGDILFVRPAGKRAAIVGSVIRPGIYELKEGEKLGDLIGLAAGLRFDAYIDRIHIERIVPFTERKLYTNDVLDFDPRFASTGDLLKSTTDLENGDIVTVLKIGNQVANRVIVSGSVRKPGPFELKTGMTIADLIVAADSLQRNTFAERASLFRMRPDTRREVYPFNLRLALERDPTNNLSLRNEDSVVIYSAYQFFPQDSVIVRGAVRHPGMYPLSERMTVTDLVMAAGGLLEEASTEGWEVSRMDTTRLGVYSNVSKVNPSKTYWNDSSSTTIALMPHDILFVPPDPHYTRQQLVHIAGYVMYPGDYSIRYTGERLSEIITRAGGLKPGAYLEGSRLIRKFNNSGMVPLEFRKALEEPDSRDNVSMYEGDSIHVAYLEDVVYVSGEVFVPSPVLYKSGASLGFYIDQAGGYKEDADDGRTVVLLPGGKKWSPGWFFFPDPEILPGSSVFVPKKVEKEDKTLPVIRDLATILASMAALTIAIVQVSK